MARFAAGFPMTTSTRILVALGIVLAVVLWSHAPKQPPKTGRR